MNIVANFVSAAYDLSNVNPKRISFRKGGIITSILALISMPWNLYNNPDVIAYFLGGLGALLGPFFGILAMDYFWYRKGRFSIPDLYLPTPRSIYYYRRGINGLAVKAFVPSAIVARSLALIPAFSPLAPFGWFVGAPMAALIYYLIANGRARGLPATEPTTAAYDGCQGGAPARRPTTHRHARRTPCASLSST